MSATLAATSAKAATSPEEEQDQQVPATPAAEPVEPQDAPAEEETPAETEDDEPAEETGTDDEEAPADDSAPAEPPADPAATAPRLSALERGKLMLSSKKSLIARIEEGMALTAAATARADKAEAALTAAKTTASSASATAAAEKARADKAEAALAAAEAEKKTVAAGVRDTLSALGVPAADAPPILDQAAAPATSKEEARRHFAELDVKDPAAARAYFNKHKDLLL